MSDPCFILVILLGSTLLSLFREYVASSAAEKLRAQVTAKATTLRDGQPALPSGGGAGPDYPSRAAIVESPRTG